MPLLQQASEETLSNIQTVVSLGLEDEFFERFRQELLAPYRYRIFLIPGTFYAKDNKLLYIRECFPIT